MTENKRFTVETFIDDYLCGFKDLEGNECEIRYDGKPMTYREVTDLLNELAEEKEYYQIKSGKCEEELLKLRRDNEQLKHDATVLIYSNQEYRKKNEQLKRQNKRLEEKIQRERTSFTETHERWSKEAENKIKELSEENEQLKEENKELKQLIKKVMDERVVDYPLLCKIKEMVKE